MYNAFISYSHTADSALAEALQAGLHRFAKPWYKLRALHIFRDQTNLAVNPALWSSIREALDQSLFFIFLASPEAAASPWVAKEAEYWAGRNGTSHLLIVLTGGTLNWDRAAAGFTLEHTNALPEGLLRSFPEEPLFLDLRWARGNAAPLRLREPRFHEAILQLASTLHNRPKDELDGVDIRRQRQTRWLAASALMIILLTVVFAVRQWQDSKNEELRRLAASLAADSARILADHPDRVREAAFLAIESNRLDPTFEGNRALRAAVALLPMGTQLYTPQNADPSARVRDLAFSPNGATLAAVRDDGTTQLFDVVHGKAVGFFAPDEKPAAQLDVSSDSQNDSSDSNSAVSVAFNSTGSLVASGGSDGVAHIWSLPDGRELLRILHAAAISQVTFRPHQNQLVTAGADGHVRLFDIESKTVAADFKCSDKVVSAAFHPDGTLLAARSSDGVISIFDVAQRRLIRTLGGGDAAFNVTFSGDGKRLSTASGSFAFVWDVATGKELLKATHAPSSETLATLDWIRTVALSPDGKWLAYGGGRDALAHVWNVETGRQTLGLQHDAPVAAVVFSTDESKLGTASYDGTARVWELPSGKEMGRSAHPQGAEAAAFSPDGNRFAAGGMGGTVSVAQTSRADRPAYFQFHDDVRSVAFSPDGSRIAMSSVSEHAFAVVRVAAIDGSAVRDIEVRGPPVIDNLFFVDRDHLIAQWSRQLYLVSVDGSSAAALPPLAEDPQVDPSGKMLAIQQDDFSRVYALPGLARMASFEGSPGKLLRTTGGGKLLAFETSDASHNHFIEIWSTASKARISRIPVASEWNHIALNAAGSLAFTTQGEKLELREIPSGKRRFSITSDGAIVRVFPDAQGAFFATSANGRLTVWDSLTGRSLAEVPGAAAAFSPDGRYLVTNAGNHSAAVWLWRSSDLQNRACAGLSSNLSKEEWARLFPKRPYHQSCPNLPAAHN